MRSFHEGWAWLAVGLSGLAGLWGLTLAVIRRRPGRWFLLAAGAAVVAVLIQVGAGLLLYADPGWREAVDGFHVFYGIVILFTLAFTYIFRVQVARRPTLWWGLILLFVMGLGIRAWTIVAG
jgi:hypothetical protein